MAPPHAALLTADPNGVAWVRARGPLKARLSLGSLNSHPPAPQTLIPVHSLALSRLFAPTHAIRTPLASTQRSAGLLRRGIKIYTDRLGYTGCLYIASIVVSTTNTVQPDLSHPSITKHGCKLASDPGLAFLLGPLGLLAWLTEFATAPIPTLLSPALSSHELLINGFTVR
ncbi:hypothetical protein BJX63DRAFT_44736 [Aspergillus granulosus]|uniref:Uncharacterized protein n=1 Tax=Aspergillus granulosus TaxID=176169 RepID=A0ABR4HTR1_9EURO